MLPFQTASKCSFLLFLALCISSCSPVLYAPKTQNIPLLQNKGDIGASVNIGSTDEISTVTDIHGAYCIRPGFGVIGNVSLYRITENEDNPDFSKNNRGGIVELGAGYLTNFTEKIVFEGYGLLGSGTIKNDFGIQDPGFFGDYGKLEASIFNVGVQANIGFKWKYLHIAMANRFSSVHYYAIEGDLHSVEYKDEVSSYKNQVDYLQNNSNHLFYEPAFMVRGALKHLKVELQFSNSFNLITNELNYDQYVLSLGAHINFNVFDFMK